MTQTVALAGLGSIGQEIVAAFRSGLPGLRLTAVSSRDAAKAALLLTGLSEPPALVTLAELGQTDIVIEALPASQFEAAARPVVEAGKVLVPCSVGALLAHEGLIRRAALTGARIVVPTGAIAGLDAVRAMARDGITSAVLESRKPPAGFRGNAYLESQGVDVDQIVNATLVFEGSARDAARLFPANANVAAALALAAGGPDRTQVRLWADPTVTRNSHTIIVEAAAARMVVTVENVPSKTNPRTSKLASLSIIACLSGLVDPIRIGS
jgi:aspartate dehydrogenase